MATIYTTGELAEKLGTDPMLLRRFLRSSKDFKSPGKGGRYQIPATRFRTLKAQFRHWEQNHTRQTAA